jgi:hypothetical protein
MPLPEPACYTINQFCETHNLSRSQLYKLWAAGTGPKRKKIGSKNLIPVECAREWRTANLETPVAA